MNILTLENITKVYTERKLFDGADFYLQEGEKIGIIGINGTGKSTLLRIMAGLEEPDEGKVVRANNIIVRFLPQQVEFEQEQTVLDSVMEGIVNHTNEKMCEAHDATYSVLMSEAKAMLMQLGINDFEQKTCELSGGQKKRIALVSVLIRPADILILDEPTNHLDHEVADWLEEQLKKWNKALIMVTHDRYFLDSVANRIIELDKGKIYSYETNYAGFLERKAEREASMFAAERKRQSILRTELKWVQRGARARTTKQKARLERYENLKNQGAPKVDSKVEMSSIASRLGKTTVELEHISKSYGEKILIDDFSYIFLKDDRIGFLGKNGCGKTTLMKILTNRVKPDKGEVIIGQTVKIGYYTQEIETEESQKGSLAYMNPDEKVIDYIRNTAEYVKTRDGSISASQMLERFLFPPEQQYSPIGKLSGGEKRRLNLLRVLMEAPNVLILDEPTNDLDITTLTILEDFLDSFEGIVIVVSHDRYFLDRIVRRIFAFEENGKLRQYEGGYTDYAMKCEMEQFMLEEANGKQSASTKSRNAREEYKKSRERKLKLTYKEEKEYEVIEEEIAELESKMEELEDEMVKNASDFVKLNEISAKKQKTEEELEYKMERWEYLEELVAKIKEQNESK